MTQEAAINNIDLSGYNPRERALFEEALTVMGDILKWDRDEIEKIMLRDWTTICRFCQGKPQGDVAGVMRDFERMVGRYINQKHARTVIVVDYERVLDNAKKDGRMGVIVGITGRSKSSTFADWSRRHPKANPIIVKCPSYCPRADLIALICDAVGINTEVIRQPEWIKKLFAKLTPRHFLLIDEAGYLADPRKISMQLRFLQDIHDICGCPIVMAMRPEQWAMIIQGRKTRDNEQFIGRIPHRSITDEISYKKDEIEMIVRLYDKAEMTGEMRKSIKMLLSREVGGLRSLGHDLQLASEFAQERGVPFSKALLAAGEIRETAPHIKKLEDF